MASYQEQQGWEEQVLRAYAVFAVDPLDHADEFGFRFPKLSISFLREKAKQQLRDALGRWRKMRGKLDGDDDGTPVERTSLLPGTPTRNPDRNLGADEEERRWEVNTGVAKRKKNGIEFIEGSPPGNRTGKNWERNGASWRSITEAAKEKILEGIARFHSKEPRAAKSIEEMKQNVIDAFNSASSVEMQYGMGWYAEGKRRINELASAYDVDPHMVAAIIAATSPRTRWEQNIAAAELAILSLDPRYSPTVDDKFLSTMVRDKTGMEYLLDNKGIQAEFAGPAPQKPKNGTKEQLAAHKEELAAHQEKAKALIREYLESTKNPDGSDLKIYQYGNRAVRAALMKINNHRVAIDDPNTKKGMGIPYQLYTSDGHLSEERNHLSGIMVTQMAALDTLYGYGKKEPVTKIYGTDWDGSADGGDDLYERIGNSLPGHKTRSFYNNLITGGRSEESITIDVHATAAALLGKLATRTGVKVKNAERLLKGDKDYGGSSVAEGRIGSYAAVHEAFRLATEAINADRAARGEPPLTGAQVQAVAWVATRDDSIAGDLLQQTMDLRDPQRSAQRVMPGLDPAARAAVAEAIGSLPKSGRDDLNAERLRDILSSEGFDTGWLTDDEYIKIKYGLTEPPWREFNARKRKGAMQMGSRFMPAISWIMHKGGDDDTVIAGAIAEAFSTDSYKPNFNAEDVQLVREVLSDMYPMQELLVNENIVENVFEAYNEARRRKGVMARVEAAELWRLFENSGMEQII